MNYIRFVCESKNESIQIFIYKTIGYLNPVVFKLSFIEYVN